MSEGMHSNDVRTQGRSRNRTLIAVAGTAVALVAAGVSIQFFRARTGGAAEGDRPAAQPAGVATLGSDAAPNSQALAKVGTRLITKQMVADEAMKKYGPEVLDKLINRTIIEQACADRGIVVTAEEVQREIVEIARKFNLDQKAWLSMLQAERGITPAQYSADVIWPMLALKKLAGSEVAVSEEDMQKTFLRDYGPRVECKMIMCDNVRRAQDVWEKAVANPDDFGRLARESSIEPTSRALEGDVPPIRRFSGNKNLEDAAFKLKAGEISGIIEVGLPPAKRYVILQCKGRTKQLVTNIEEVREQLYAQLTEEKTQEAVASVFETIKQEIRVDNYVNQTVSGGPASNAGIQKTSGEAAPVRNAPPSRNAAPVAPPANRTTNRTQPAPR